MENGIIFLVRDVPGIPEVKLHVESEEIKPRPQLHEGWTYEAAPDWPVVRCLDEEKEIL